MPDQGPVSLGSHSSLPVPVALVIELVCDPCRLGTRAHSPHESFPKFCKIWEKFPTFLAQMESCRGRWGDGAREGAQPPLQPLRRVRLEFHSPDFVTSAKEGKEDPEETIVGELRRSWLLVPSSAREVNDLAWLIADKFHLKKTWRQGSIISLQPSMIFISIF